jgi:hypothetical protein
MDIFLEENRFVAVRGITEALILQLRDANMLAFWNPPWVWKPEQRCFILPNGRKCRPELTISFRNQPDQPVLLSVGDVVHAIHAIHWIRQFPAAGVARPRRDLTFTFAHKKTSFGPTEDDAVEWLGANVFWWCAQNTKYITVFPETKSTKPVEAAAKFERAIQARCQKERARFKKARQIQDPKERKGECLLIQMQELARRTREVVIDIERAVVACRPEKALRDFHTVATWLSLFIHEQWIREFRWIGELRDVAGLYAHGCYWIAHLDETCGLGWSERDTFQEWAFRRLSTATECRRTHPSTKLKIWSTNKITKVEIYARLRTMELMIPSGPCRQYILESMAWIAAVFETPLDSYDSAVFHQQRRRAARNYEIQFRELVRCDQSDSGSCPSSLISGSGEFSPLCLRKRYTPAEQQVLAGEVARLKTQSCLRFGNLSLIDKSD